MNDNLGSFVSFIKNIIFIIFSISSLSAQETNSLAIYENSDTCSSRKIILVLDEKTDCTHLINNKSTASSVKINGKCSDITDTSLEKACLSLQEKSGMSTIYEDSDSCSHRDLVLSVGNYTNCREYSEVNKNAASIKINGKCLDITDTTIERACNDIQLKRGLNAIYASSNDCSKNDAFIFLNDLTNCQKLEGRASSVSINGECTNITETSLTNACLDIQEKVGYSMIYSKSDSCRSRNVLASVNELTNCHELTGQATSVKINNKCQDITDTSSINSCLDIQRKLGLGAIYSGSDNCSRSSITHTLTKLNDCKGLEGSASSISINGKCQNITDTSAVKACVEIQSESGLSIIYESSDDCSKNDEMTVLTDYTKCSSLKGSASSIKVKGKCQNITDTTLEKSCLKIKEDK